MLKGSRVAPIKKPLDDTGIIAHLRDLAKKAPQKVITPSMKDLLGLFKGMAKHGSTGGPRIMQAQ